MTNGLGGYTSGPVGGGLTRRYHGLLIAALPAPLGRMLYFTHLRVSLVSGHREFVVDHEDSTFEGQNVLPLTEFALESGLPVWTYGTDDLALEKRVVMPHGENLVYVSFRVRTASPVTLRLAPLFHIRRHDGAVGNTDDHAPRCVTSGDTTTVDTSPGAPKLVWRVTGAPARATFGVPVSVPVEYPEERQRGYDFSGALWMPGWIEVDLTPDADEVEFIASAEVASKLDGRSMADVFQAETARRSGILSRMDPADDIAAELALAADQFVVTPASRAQEVAAARAAGEKTRSIFAGYHWFTDWGRDTMISLEGLTLANATAFNRENCVAPEQDGIAGPITTLIGIGQPINPVDPLTLVITLAQPSMQFLAALASPIAFAVPQRLVQQYGAQWTAHLTDHGGIGGGLFQLNRTPQQGGLRLIRNTAFWGATPRLREIDYSLYATPAQAAAAYQAGKLDIDYPTAEQVAAAPRSAAFQHVPLLHLVYLGLNWRVTPFTDQQMRLAFALAIDKQSIVTNQLNGLTIATNHIIPQGMPAYNPALVGPDSSQQLNGAKTQAVNLAQTYASRACNGAFAQCPVITLEVPAEDANASEVAAEIARMWQAIAPGYPLAIRVEPEAQLQQRIASGMAQFYLSEWVADFPDAQDALGRFTPAAPGVSGSVNLPDATTLLTTAVAEQDPTQRAKDYQAAEQLLVSAVAIIPLYQEQFFWQTPAHVQNVTFDPQGQMSIYDTLPSVVIMRTA